ncbi:hypothetical protein SDC9_109898 [bioreactor metagenome]|uniref:Uncharacterized protein n=1 Tax=bioreactor metagenome TaxID=1076179 RepID=A0A645BC30_9ZZZZ
MVDTEARIITGNVPYESIVWVAAQAVLINDRNRREPSSDIIFRYINVVVLQYHCKRSYLATVI